MQKMMLAILVLTIVPIVSPCSIASGTLHCTNLQRAVSTLQRGISISIMTIDNAATTGQLIDLSRFPRLQKIQILNTDLTCDDFKLTRGTTLMLKDKFCEYSGTTEASYHTTKSFASVLTESAAVAFNSPWIIATGILTGIVVICVLCGTVLLIRRLFRKRNSLIRIDTESVQEFNVQEFSIMREFKSD
ncbi:uncharacterized protein LOC133198664 isoform X1 [Saccostrea echinata]|uniref:uncharacterized protein LOC133198664 isoform X1 n=1 Tax=Saccostrea echinata TaxID=191078 RepID=UPI002A802FF3|nr:uncharacterized protein LOC133198664 isoform X1 [Saccostrea echinata]